MEPNNELLREALLEAALEEFRDIPAEEEISLEFSPGFEQRLRLRLAEEGLEEPPLRLRFSRSFRRLAVAVLILALLAATAAVASPTLRENLLRFFPQETATHYEFTFDPEQAATAPKTIETVYLPAYLPDGYNESFSFIGAAGVLYTWYNDSGSSIGFNQLVIPKNDGEGPWVDSEDVSASLVDINGYAVFQVYSDGYMYYWTDNEYFYSLIFSADIPEDECIKVFTSISPHNT